MRAYSIAVAPESLAINFLINFVILLLLLFNNIHIHATQSIY
jgi:hypothetical protein